MTDEVGRRCGYVPVDLSVSSHKVSQALNSLLIRDRYTYFVVPHSIQHLEGLSHRYEV